MDYVNFKLPYCFHAGAALKYTMYGGANTMPKMRLSDIAESLGVSTATVSNALNRKNGVSPEKAEQIRAAAARMGYFQTRQSEKRSIRFLIYKKHGKVLSSQPRLENCIAGI